MVGRRGARGLGSEAGATALEYSIMAALIAAVIVAIVYVVGQQTKDMFSCTAESIDTRTNVCNP